MRDLGLITIADDGTISFGYTGKEVACLDLIIQHLCVALLSDTRNFVFGVFPGGDLGDFATYSDHSQFAAEAHSRLSFISRWMAQDHLDFRDAVLEKVNFEPITKSLSLVIVVITDYGRRYIKLPLGA